MIICTSGVVSYGRMEEGGEGGGGGGSSVRYPCVLHTVVLVRKTQNSELLIGHCIYKGNWREGVFQKERHSKNLAQTPIFYFDHLGF